MRFANKIESIKNDILGKDYSLSIAYVAEEKSREINKKYRRKNKPTNVLSFSLRKNSGEIILCPSIIKEEAKNFGEKFPEYLLFLVIHAILHLKGMEHSSTMEEAEKKYYNKYDKEYFSRNRRRVLKNEGRGGGVLKRREKS